MSTEVPCPNCVYLCERAQDADTARDAALARCAALEVALAASDLLVRLFHDEIVALPAECGNETWDWARTRQAEIDVCLRANEALLASTNGGET